MCNTIKLYVADLAAYNNGKLHGVWVNACDELDTIKEQINAMLADSPEGFAEEYAIHDHEGFEGYAVGEYEGLDQLHYIALFIDEHGAITGALLNHFGGDLDAAREAMQDNYAGCHTSLASFAEEITSETIEIPPHIAYFIDYEHMGRDWELSGDIYTIKFRHSEVHVFWNR
jgi:antirestriction protein